MIIWIMTQIQLDNVIVNAIAIRAALLSGYVFQVQYIILQSMLK